jgi:hypothetical protein
MKSKFTTLAEQVLAGSVSGSSPEGRACVKKFLSLLINEYAYIDKSQANSILKQYDQDPKSLGEQMTQMLDELGFNENSINDTDLFEDDGLEKISFKKAEKWAHCLDTIARETGVDMSALGFSSSYTYKEYVAGCYA